MMIKLKNLNTVKLLIVSLTLLLSINSAYANVGKIIYGYGNNYALDLDGNRRSLKKGDVIKEGDTLVTGRGRVHVRLIDGGFVSVYPNSEYRIDKFKFSGKKKTDNTSVSNNKKRKPAIESKQDRGFFSLLKGAARQVTGLLGRTYNNNFKFKTSVATIGIRGTGFFA
ncbi:MAG: FecR domain-containing protein, partial [Gammaproteobacteria bacterium]|nr:FecR domain-containing protein [Gammaproteobacteria bacterium]